MHHVLRVTKICRTTIPLQMCGCHYNQWIPVGLLHLVDIWVVSCVIGHTHQLVSEVENMAKGCPLPDTMQPLSQTPCFENYESMCYGNMATTICTNWKDLRWIRQNVEHCAGNKETLFCWWARIWVVGVLWGHFELSCLKVFGWPSGYHFGYCSVSVLEPSPPQNNKNYWLYMYYTFSLS